MSAATVRPARIDDAAAMARVNVRAWRIAYRDLVSQTLLDELSVTERERRIRERLGGDAATSFTLVSEQSGVVAGFCRVATPGHDDDAGVRIAEITGLYVDPTVWRTGVGTALLAEALLRLRAAGYREVTLWVFAANAAARTFYDRFGFKPTGATAIHERTGVPEVRLRAPLVASAR